MAVDVPRPRADLEAALAEQLGFLETSARLYDEGVLPEAKRMTTSLRILLHDSRNSKSLLGQLGYLTIVQFHDSTGPDFPGNLLTECPLVMMQLGGTGQDFVPLLDRGPFASIPKSFATWWNMEVFKDNVGQRFSRRDIVLSVADQDGGAHVDPALNDGYHRLSRENSLAWIVGSPEGVRAAQNPVPAAVRQVTFEALKSLVPAKPLGR
jgi:hypothetical protein